MMPLGPGSMLKHGRLMGMLFLGLLPLETRQLSAQGVTTPGEVCKPASERTQEVGCWVMADDPVGQLTRSQVFWHLDGYSTRAAAQVDEGPQGTVIESLCKVWLMDGRRNLPGDLRWTRTDRPSRWPAGDRPHGIVDEPHRDGHPAASCDSTHPSSVIETCKHDDP